MIYKREKYLKALKKQVETNIGKICRNLFNFHVKNRPGNWSLKIPSLIFQSNLLEYKLNKQ